jgi:hypothetical protein
MIPLGPNRKLPAARSRMAAKTLGASGLGRHIHSTRPLGAMSALTSQSERKANSAIGGKALASGVKNGAGAISALVCPSPLTAGLIAGPRSSTPALRSVYVLLFEKADDMRITRHLRPG